MDDALIMGDDLRRHEGMKSEFDATRKCIIMLYLSECFLTFSATFPRDDGGGH